MTRLLITGKNGQVGAELVSSLAPLGEVFAFDRQTLDLGAAADIVKTVREVKPDIIVNAGAYTAVDRAETEPALATAINAAAPGILATEAQRLGAWLVHYSTDYVFNGNKTGAYDEQDAPDPLSAYGRSKLAGDIAVQTSGARHLILRTSWVYGAAGKNFLLTVLRLAAERDELKIVDDQIGAPTWSRDIAAGTAGILKRIAAGGPAVSGVYNMTAAGSTSWHGFAAAILAEAAATSRIAKTPRLLPIPTSEYPLPAARPRNSVLAHGKLKRTFGIELPDWRASLKACLAGK